MVYQIYRDGILMMKVNSWGDAIRIACSLNRDYAIVRIIDDRGNEAWRNV